MKLLDSILVAIDFSDLTHQTLDEAVYLAKRFDAVIIPLHAIEYVPYYAYEEGLHLIRKEIEGRMARIVDGLRQRGVTVADSVVSIGAAWDLIVSTADARDVNMILLGGARKSLAERLLAGSTAEKVLRRARQPVLIMHHGDPRPEVHRVLCAVDFSAASDQAMSTAQHLCHVFGAQLKVLHVQQGEAHYPGLPGLDVPVQKVHAGNESGEPSDAPSGADELRGYLERFDLTGIEVSTEVRTEVRTGDVADAIMDAAQGSGCDLLVMGAIGHGSFIHQLLGNTTEKILRRVHCSLLAVKHQDIFRVRHDAMGEHDDDAQYLRQVDEIAAYLEKHYSDGQSLLANGFHDDAMAEFHLCLERDPHFHAAYEGLALACERSGRHDQAMHFQDEARRHRRSHLQARARDLLRSGDHTPGSTPAS